MSFLELRTLIILTMLANFVFAAVLLTVRRMAPGEESIRFWAQGAFASGFGNLLFTLRGVIPDFGSVILANALFAWGYASLYLGSRQFVGQTKGARLDYLLGGFVLIAFIPFTYIYPSLEIRILLISLVLGTCSLIHARLMLAAKDESLGGLPRFVGWTLLFVGILMLVRGFFAPFTTLSENFFDYQDWIKSSAFLVSLLISMSLGAAFPIMVIGRMKHALAEREMRAHAMLQAMPDMMFRINRTGTLLDGKPHTHAPADFQSALLPGGNFFDALPADFATQLQQTIDTALLGNTVESLEYQADTHCFEIRIAASGMDEVTMIVRDISERKRNEAEIESHRNHLEELVVERTQQLNTAKEAAEAANIAKGAFLANISHEMRTPMHQIGGLIGLIRRESLSQKQTDFLSKLDFTSQRMTRLIETVLEITRIEANKFEMSEKAIDLDQLLQQLKSAHNDQATSKGLVLNTENRATTSEFIGDLQHIRLALSNFVENAIRFTEAGHIRLTVQTEQDNAQDALLKFTIEDSGIGIAPEVLPQLFQLFQQADNSMTRKFGGTGAGLYISRRIAQLMGGDAGGDSQLGQGSVFWFTVRLKKRG